MIPNITQNKNNIRFQKHSLISFFILEQPNRHITSEFRNYETTSEFRIDRHSEGILLLLLLVNSEKNFDYSC
ncbi:hypothetical protein HanXRQr2_Chr15g0697901 [Helianthus annuus]|uniref:Uncharacterized protein n=1 Tax=Helianthus annuus TaxID=4232 RepID=A0A9K3E165_HELAN|nr:hypothetical protein HanXRQr2_Chr15g0697901 [Helianthus annuus]KAJ0831661.1 hypothetical protein HanPSC8_Chr15g0669611 [Helianthus annuus]